MLFAGEGVFAKDTGKLIPSTNHCSSLLLTILFRGEKEFYGKRNSVGFNYSCEKKKSTFHNQALLEDRNIIRSLCKTILNVKTDPSLGA